MPIVRVCGHDIRFDGRLLTTARLDGEKFKFLEDPEPVVEGLRSSSVSFDLFTFLQRLPDTAPRYAYPMEWDNLAVLPVSTFENWWRKQIGFKARNKAKQAEKKGVELKEVPFDEAIVGGIWEVYNECPVRQGKRFPHYGMDVETVRKHAGTFLDSSIFIGAFLGGRLIGFAKLVTDQTRTQAGLMHIVSLIEHRDKAPNNALIAQAVRSCAERNIPYLVYSNFAYGNKQRDSLSEFKERNAFERVNLPRYYVPLTAVGSVALRLRLHRRPLNFVPESAISRLRGLRSAWYRYRLRTAGDAF